MLSAEVEGWMDDIIQNIGFIPKPKPSFERLFLYSFHLSRFFSRVRTCQSPCYKASVVLRIVSLINLSFSFWWMIKARKEKQNWFFLFKADWIIPNKRPANEWPGNGNVTFKNFDLRYREGYQLWYFFRRKGKNDMKSCMYILLDHKFVGFWED